MKSRKGHKIGHSIAMWNVPSVVVGCRILNYHRVQWHLELWVLPTTNARGEERERKRGAMANRNSGA